MHTRSFLSRGPGRTPRLVAAAGALFFSNACTVQQDASARTGEARAVKVATLIDFHGPESVLHDPEQDVYFVSNINGFGSVKDDNGYISRVRAGNPSEIDTFIAGGRAGVTLHAPKGMALHGDTLWVADIDALRGFDRHGGAPLATIDFTPYGAVLLNDVAIGPTGHIRVTDSGIQMTEKGILFSGGDKLFSVGPDHQVTVIASGPHRDRPNGITWDAAARRWLYVTFDPFHSRLYAMPGGIGDTARAVLDSGHGRWDGVAVLPDGRILFSSWTDSSVHLVDNGRDRRIVRNVPNPADIGLDAKRGLVLVPLVVLGRVELWSVPARR